MDYSNKICDPRGPSVGGEQPTRVPEIEEVMQRLRSRISDVQERVFLIEKKLNPILSGNTPNADGGKVSKGYATPLGGILGECVESLSNIERALVDLTLRVEL